MRAWLLTFLILGPCLRAHDLITTPITFNREIARIVYARCGSCHHPGGTAFSLLTYADARPWAVAIKEEVLSRRMPPWGAVKGFGDFQNDQALTPEQLEVITGWVEGGVPEGLEKDLPKVPKWERWVKSPTQPVAVVSGPYTLKRPVGLGGLQVVAVGARSSMKVTALLPDGSMEPLLWLEGYKPAFAHPFFFRKPLTLPAGTILLGVPGDARLALLPQKH